MGVVVINDVIDKAHCEVIVSANMIIDSWTWFDVQCGSYIVKEV